MSVPKVCGIAAPIPNLQHFDTIIQYAIDQDKRRSRDRKRPHSALRKTSGKRIFSQKTFRGPTLKKGMARSLWKDCFVISPKPDEVR